MGLHITKKKHGVDIWGCVSSGCVRYEETEFDVYASLEDTRTKDGLKVEKRLWLKKRKGYEEVIEDFFNDELPDIEGEPKADEGELLEAYRYIAERLKHSVQYVGLKLEYISPRGIRVYFRVRLHDRSDGAVTIVEMSADKDGEKISYFVYGETSNARVLQREVVKAIAAYILFSNFIFLQPVQEQQKTQQTEQGGEQQSA